MLCTSYVQIFSKKDRFPSLPLSQDDKFTQEALEAIPIEIKDAIGYREFLNERIKFGQQGINEFREVRERNNV